MHLARHRNPTKQGIHCLSPCVPTRREKNEPVTWQFPSAYIVSLLSLRNLDVDLKNLFQTRICDRCVLTAHFLSFLALAPQWHILSFALLLIHSYWSGSICHACASVGVMASSSHLLLSATLYCHWCRQTENTIRKKVEPCVFSTSTSGFACIGACKTYGRVPRLFQV